MRSKTPTVNTALSCIVLVLSFFVLACSSTKSTAVAASGGRVFYVANYGHDYYRHNSRQHPWRTVARVNGARLRPGDIVLFKGGEHFRDTTLMPGGGFLVSGTNSRPITFGSYGLGRATITQGIWLGTSGRHPRGPSHLVFNGLALGPVQGFQGTGDYIALEHMKIANLMPGSNQEIGIMTRGSHWYIVNNTISRTGDSGMLLGFSADSPGAPQGGHDYYVANNLITNTGLDSGINYGSHGIYLKVANATITHNWIANFHDDGVSARYHNATITNNVIGDGSIGIAWFQYDRVGGVSRFENNLIVGTTSAGIFVCGTRQACRKPLESFIIQHNTIKRRSGSHVNLQPTAGRYNVTDNP